MSYKPHYIAAYDQDSGLFKYSEPFLAPEKAFSKLENAYCWRNRVQKKLGVTLLGRLRRVISDTLKIPISNAITIYNLFSGLMTPITETYAQIQPGSIADPLTITIAAPISQTLIDTLGTGVLTIAPAGLITSATINYNSGDLTLTFSGPAGPAVATVKMAYYPSLPVMGCRLQETIVTNEENTIFFDTVYAYLFNSTTQEFDEYLPLTATRWTGSNFDFFWTTNYWKSASNPLFWVTNDNMGVTRDPIRYCNAATYTVFNPTINAAGWQLYNSRIILPYKDRLLFLNTWETIKVGVITDAINFQQRVRWSWNGDPTNASAFLDDQPGYGGYLDAPTSEQIISAEFIKDVLIVKFERSSWKLVYTGNEVLPFVFQKINTELGSESTFSLIPFDRGIFSVGNVGITTDDSINVERIDVQIPDVVFDFNNDNNGVKRVYGIRDYSNELVYWTYPNFSQNPTYPNMVLCYNYRNNTYAQFNDSFTCYGYFQFPKDALWYQLPYSTWADWPGIWASAYTQSQFPNVVAGNQQGFIELVQSQLQNDSSLFIYAIDLINEVYISPDHNLQDNDVVEISRVTGTLGAILNGNRFTIALPKIAPAPYAITDSFKLLDINGNEIKPVATYLGGGLITKIDNMSITTKVFAPFYEQGFQCRLGYIDFLLSKTEEGQITSQIYIDENNSFSMSDTTVNTALLGTNIIFTKPENLSIKPFQALQDKIWHTQFVQTISQNFQVQLVFTKTQLFDPKITSSNVILHAMTLYLSPNARMTP